MFKEQFAALNRRDQQTLLIALPIVALLLLWLIVVNPQIQRHAQLEKQVTQKQSDFEWMQQVAASLQNQQSGTSNTVEANALRQVATQAFTRQKITINRIQSNRDNELSMWADEVVFDQLLSVVETLTNRGITLAQIQLNPTSAGRVNVRLTLSVGS